MKKSPVLDEEDPYLGNFPDMANLDPENEKHLPLFERHNIEKIRNHGVPQNDEILNAMTPQDHHEHLFGIFQEHVDSLEDFRIDDAPYQANLDDVYNPTYFMNFDKEHTGIRGDRVMEQIYLDLEYILEERIAKPRKEAGSMPMKKGETKLWQVLDDAGHDPEEIAKIQSAIRAPSPAELDEYREKDQVQLQFPINNANVQKWRDDPKAFEEPEFDFAQLLEKKNKTKTFYLDRYEKPKELARS